MKEIYLYTRLCKCGKTDFINVTKIEAAFNLKHDEALNKKCASCDKNKLSSLALSQPDIDNELLTLWSKEPNYYFSSQDEDLVLAQFEDNIDLYLEFIDSEQTPIYKKAILTEALCVMIFDRIQLKTTESQDPMFQKLISELKKRKEVISTMQYQLMDYIKTVVFPVLEIND